MIRKDGDEKAVLKVRGTEQYQHIIYLTNMCKRLAEQQSGEIAERQILLTATTKRTLWRAMIANFIKGYVP